MLKKSSQIFFSILIVFFTPGPARAIETHEGIEGLISHQIGHILFLAGMCFFLYWLHKDKKFGKSWRRFKIFLFFIIAWNGLTFAEHLLSIHIIPEKINRVDHKIVALTADSMADYLFYFSQFDHFLLIPALIFLLRAIRDWTGQTPIRR